MRFIQTTFRRLPQSALPALIGAAAIAACAIFLLYVYSEVRTAAKDAANTVFTEASARVDQQIESFLDRAMTLARIGAANNSADLPIPADGRNHPAFRTLAATAKANPSTYAAYYGHPDGDFLEVIAVRGSWTISRALKAPPATEFAVRTNRTEAGHSIERWIFLDSEYRQIGDRLEPNATYDPRKTAWYKGALASDGPTLTRPYWFSSMPVVGITASHKLPDNGGVFGCDLLLSELRNLATARKVSQHSRIYLLNDQGLLVAAPASGGGYLPEDRMLRSIATLTDPVLAMLDEMRRSGSVKQTEQTRVESKPFVAAVWPVKSSGERLNIGIAAPLADFTGHLQYFLVLLIVMTGLTLCFAIYLVARFASQAAKAAAAKRLAGGADPNLRNALSDAGR